ncbi:hypothetical protein BLNAU_10289 [Blattamonas nauphoetae]|uniref:Uncharacterized protein n=1 Tax=Blattamonas nauphoetae TaxID=2049346 RepID=A0ABQ9XTK2_9EUKA|nr:hypothetical protein BLNAU_10289 [Blattamonas nauphoetae]
MAGCEIEVRDACLIGGTGPLFNFSGVTQTKTDDCSISTTLSSSLLLNTTSDSGCGSVDVKVGGCDFGSSESVSQKMIGSCVSHCTNHLYGTGIRDLNLGGSVLCSNTSFTHCTTQPTKHNTNKHYNRTQTIRDANYLHIYTQCTFRRCSGDGAIDIFRVSVDLEIVSCSFDLCWSGSAGGGVSFSHLDTQSSITVSSSSFVNGSSNQASAGGIYIHGVHALSISDCMFLECRTSKFGGAIFVGLWDAQDSTSGLSNCLFTSCSTSDPWEGYYGGGALYFSDCKSIRLDSLSFRGCRSGTMKGQDLFFNTSKPQEFPLPEVSTLTVSNCYSTSYPEWDRIYPTDLAPSFDFLQTPHDSVAILSLVAQQTTSTTAEIVVTLERAAEGSLLVLVSNTEGPPQTEEGKAPNIARLLLFSIQSLETGRCTASVGDTGLLQLPLEKYQLIDASLAAHDVWSYGVWVDARYPTFTSAECVLDESHTHANLNLNASNLEDVAFEFTLQNGRTHEANFSANKATIDLGVIGESSGWMENQLYVIMSGTKKDDSLAVSIPSPIYFKIPLAARLINIEVSELNEAKTEVTLSFSSRNLKANQDYEITFERRKGNEKVVMNVTTNNNGLLADQIMKLSPLNENGEEWKNSLRYGEEYEVIGVSVKIGEEDYPTLFSAILLKMPMEPVRITSALCTDDDPDRTVVTVKGSGFVYGEFYTVSVSGHPIGSPPSPPPSPHETSFVVTALSTEEARSSPLQLHPSEGRQLFFSYSYTITAITNGSETGIVESTPSFMTRSAPSQPSLVSISCRLKEGDAKTVEVSLSGSTIPDGEYRLILENKVSRKETVLKINIVNSEGKVEVEIFSSSSLEYGAEYEVLSLSSSSLRVALPTEATARSLEVPAPPRVTAVSCEISGEKKTHVKIVIFGENLPSESTLSVKVKEVDSGGSLIGSVIDLPDATTTSGDRTEPIEIELYEAISPCLKFGKTYQLTSLTISGTLAFILDDSVRFSVPREPVRITSALCTDDDPDRTVVTVKGSGFVYGEFYTVSVSGHPIGSPPSPPPSPHETSFVVTALSTEEARSSPLQLHPSEGRQLFFSYSYTITAITNGSETGIVESTPSFMTRSAPSQPSLVSISCRLKEGDAKTVEVSLSGSTIPDGEYRLILENKVSRKETVLKINIVNSEGKVEVEIFSSSSLEYGAEYEVLSLSSSSLRVALPTEATARSLEVPAPPRVTAVSCEISGEKKTHVKIVIFGENLPSESTLSVKVKEVDSGGSLIGSVIDLPDATTTSGDRTEPIEIELYEAISPCLKFGKTYQLTSLTISGTLAFILDDSVRFSVPREPVRITSALCTDDDPDRTVVTVKGSGFVYGEFYTVSVSGHPIGSPPSPPPSPHETSFVVTALSTEEARSSPLQLHPSEGRQLFFSYSYTITAITNGSETGIVESTPSFMTRSAPSQPSLVSISCRLKEGDAKTVEVSLSGSTIPDGEYRLILENKVSRKETVLKINIVNSEGKVEVEIFSSSSLEYGAEYEVLSLSSSSLRVALPTEATARSLEVPAPPRVTAVSCEISGEKKTHVKIVIFGENLPSESTLSVKVKEVDSGGSLIGSVIDLPDATTTSGDRTEPIEIELYEAISPCLKFGKTYQLTSLTISGTLAFILDDSVRFSVPREPVRITSALCTDDDPDRTVVTVKGSGFVYGEFYTVSVTSTLLSYSYTITAITNGSETGIVESTPSFMTRSAPSQPSLVSISCRLKEGDAKTVEVSLSGSTIPDGEYRLILENKVSRKETVLKINIVNSEGKVEVEIFSSSSLEYGAEYEVLSLSSSSLRVALPTEATARSLEVPAPPRVTAVSCEISGEKKTHVKIVIFGENLPSESTLSVKVKEVDSGGSLIGSVIDLPDATTTSGDRTEPIEIELYEAISPCLKFGKTYQLTSLTISGTLAFILDDSVRFSVPREPVRITSALCTDDDPDRTVVTVKGSGFVYGEFYTVSVSGHPNGSPPSPPPSPHETSFVVTALSTEEARSSPLQLHPAEGSKLKFSFSYSIVGISNGSMIGVVHYVVFDTQDDVKRDDALITKIEVVLASSLNTSMMVEMWGSKLPSGTVGMMTMNDSISFDVSFSSDTFGRSAVIELGVSGSLGFGEEYNITTLKDSNNQAIQIKETTFTTPQKPSKLSLCVCGKEEKSGLEMSGADPETCNGIKSAWNTATSLGILDTTMRIVDSADLFSPLIVTHRIPLNLLSFQIEPATLRASPSSSQQTSALVSVEEGGLCRFSFLTITTDLSVSTFKLVSAEKGTVVIRSCSIEGTGQSESNSEDMSICGWSGGLIELIEADTELTGVTMKEIGMGALWMRGGKLNITKSDFSLNGPSIPDFPSARQNIHCEGEGIITIHSLSEGDGTKNSPSAWLDVSECRMEGDEDIARSPLFVPTLNSAESTVETDKSGKQTAKVVGKTLIPCELSLEVFEWDSSKSVEGKSEIVDLSIATHWNETEIIIPFTESDVPELNRKMEW